MNNPAYKTLAAVLDEAQELAENSTQATQQPFEQQRICLLGYAHALNYAQNRCLAAVALTKHGNLIEAREKMMSALVYLAAASISLNFEIVGSAYSVVSSEKTES